MINNCNISVVTSAAGGVGKTTIAMNSAIYLNSIKKKVLLIDFTVYGGLDVIIRESKRTSGLGSLYSLFEQRELLDISKSITDCSDTLGCDVLINTSALTMEKMGFEFVEKLIEAVAVNRYTDIIIDTSCELSERNSKLFQLADSIIYVLTQDISTCWRTIKHMEILDKLQVDRKKIKIIMNRYRKDIIFNKEEFEEELSYKIISVIKDKKGEITNMHNGGKTILQTVLNRHSKQTKNAISQLWRD